ncbi:MAG: ABC transporter ATP-binding protein [Pseudomonadota bacterium]|nr:ABC transporter ATP-binding protein [Pseudomonadota bacterium]
MTDALKLDHLKLNFGGLAVTDDVSFTLPVGARTALIGPNGAGKTTLINLMSGLLAPDHGDIYLMGEKITHQSAVARVHLGLVRSFQVTRLFTDMTVEEHLLFSVRAQQRKMRGVWRDMGSDDEMLGRAYHFIDQLGLKRLATRTVSEIAYGEQRLVEIAIAIAMQPKVLLLDEPAAGVPGASMDLVMKALDELPADLAVLMIDHDMDLVRRFARDIVVLASGKVIATGTPEEIGRNELVRSAYLGVEE